MRIPVSIIIVTYNSALHIWNCLDSLLCTILPIDEVCIIDNNSADNTVELIEQHPLKVRLIQESTNTGFTKANNKGIIHSEKPMIVLLNADVVVSFGWLERLLYHFESGNVAGVGPITNFAVNKQRMDLYTTKTDSEEIYEDNKGISVDTKLLINYCAMYSRLALKQVGYLDSSLFLGNDDLDLSWRLHLNNWKLKIATDVAVHHVGNHSFSSVPKEKLAQMFQESTDQLYLKLQRYYKTQGLPIPKPMTLWGIDWFKPSNTQ